MTARFKCPECNHPLHNRHGEDPTKGCVLRCPECGARLVVPAALASFAHPQIDTPIPATADDGPEMPLHGPVVLPAMAKSMPWLMSTFFHVALAMIFMFVAMIAVVDKPEIADGRVRFDWIADPTRISDTLPTPPRPRPDPLKHRKEKNNETNKKRKLVDQMEKSEIGSKRKLTGIKPDGKPSEVIGVSGAGEFFGVALHGGEGNDGEDGEKDGGGGGRFPDVVYLIDRSGSMVDTFATVRQEMLMSIGRMTPDRQFHVVLFSDGRPMEKSPRRMTPATDTAKVKLVEFLKPVCASGKTDPIPAINRAFDVLKRKDGLAGKRAVIYLLTDGVFPDNDAVMETIRRRNTGHPIRIYTILHGNRSPIAEEVMTRIAADSRGEYRFVSRDE